MPNVRRYFQITRIIWVKYYLNSVSSIYGMHLHQSLKAEMAKCKAKPKMAEIFVFVLISLSTLHILHFQQHARAMYL